MQAEMMCTNTQGGVFVAYCPWLTKPIHVVPISRDEETCKAIEERVVLANEMIEKIISETQNIRE